VPSERATHHHPQIQEKGPLRWALYELVDYSVIRGWDFTPSGQQQATNEIATALGTILEVCE
jgi:hypothetical protein